MSAQLKPGPRSLRNTDGRPTDSHPKHETLQSERINQDARENASPAAMRIARHGAMNPSPIEAKISAGLIRSKAYLRRRSERQILPAADMEFTRVVSRRSNDGGVIRKPIRNESGYLYQNCACMRAATTDTGPRSVL